ncbi:putative UDP-rhamnose:rhamnosyltransferase 1 [Acorus calamus]|uniref:UDP-rhamnose:rhamnosyltransferase 1 n=1 Tax=Acorus calamus TaxID=4465 RepID=A0AAV9F0J8_ACOCL|nr:putative UDP-rhamnose:rhamnosyltransferase 1 [Acorus calamus]
MEDERSLHVVMFPWLAFGHMVPFLELSKALAKRGHHITYVSTPRNLKRLPPLPPHLTQTITFVALPFPSIDGLPDQAEATSDLPLESVEYLKKAYDELKTPITTLISARRPDWIIHDFSSYWLPDVASELGVPCAYFSTFPAAVLAVWEPCLKLSSRCAPPEKLVERLTSPPELADFPTKVANLPFEAKQLLDFNFTVNASGVSDALRLGTSIRRCRALLVRGCLEFESDWFSLLAKLYETRIIPVGPLTPSAEEDSTREDDPKVFEWLDKQPPKSVVYVAFGSEAHPSREQAREIALGLEASGLSFFWVTRDAWMPSGFKERIKGRGFIQMGWVPQMKILAHEAIGGFMTHSGWGSLIEVMQFGIPLVFFPIMIDQGINARVFGEKGIGVEVPRDALDGSVTSDDVAKTLRLVMVEEGGAGVRSRVGELKSVFGDRGLQGRYVDELVRLLKETT